MKQEDMDATTLPDLSSLSNSPCILKTKSKKGYRKCKRITPSQKALLIDQFFFHNKKIKEVNKNSF